MQQNINHRALPFQLCWHYATGAMYLHVSAPKLTGFLPAMDVKIYIIFRQLLESNTSCIALIQHS